MFRYRGYYYDNETGLYYLQSRYYNPEIGRFINADVAEILFATQGEILGANLFSYCGNNPVMLSDPSGYFTQYTSDKNWTIQKIRIANIQGLYVGRSNCIIGILNILLLGAMTTYAIMDFAIKLISVAIAGKILTMALSSTVTTPMILAGILTSTMGIAYGTYMTSLLIFAIDYTKKYNRFRLKKVWKFSEFIYTISRW